MINSYECSILRLYSGIFADIRVSLPTVGGLDRDESRLLSTAKSRGLRYLTIDLPAYGKHFDRCLDEGRLTPSCIPNFGYSKRGKRGHAFLRGLILRVFSHDGLLLSQPCVTTIFLLRQLFGAVKKIKVDCPEKVRDSTIARYIDQERSLRSPSLDWHGDCLDHRGGDRLRIDDVRFRDRGADEDLFEDLILQRAFCDTVHSVADRIATSIGSFDPMGWRPKHGPGAVADAKKGHYKYNFPTWSSRLEGVFPSADFAYANYGAWADSVLSGTCPTNDNVPSYVLTVPKSQKGPRIIAKEPIANMWCQQAIRDFLENRLAHTDIAPCIHFRDQGHNGRAALRASLSRSHWTIDLSDASDRVTLWLVERLFRKNKSLLEALHSSRSTFCMVPLGGRMNYLLMKKFAPQGAATTFPLQTYVYAILAVSSVLFARNLPVTTRNLARVAREVLVFGDDSLVPSDCGRQYVDLLTYCGFTVNYAKTYGKGYFRESCGVEAYQGVDVTPAYLTNPYQESVPESVASTVMCSNNFFMKGLWHSAAALESTLPHWMRTHLNVVGPGSGAFGLTSFCGDRSVAKRRYNSTLHREECLALSLSTEVTRTQPGGFGHLLQYFTETPSQDIPDWMSGVDGRPSSKVRKKWEPVPMTDCGHGIGGRTMV